MDELVSYAEWQERYQPIEEELRRIEERINQLEIMAMIRRVEELINQTEILSMIGEDGEEYTPWRGSGYRASLN